MKRNLLACLFLIAFCSIGAWWVKPRIYSIEGVHLNENASEIRKRFPECRDAPNGMQMASGESHLSHLFQPYKQFLELAPNLIVALDEKGTVRAIEGSYLERNGQPILGPLESSEKISNTLGGLIDGASCDADYLAYRGHIILRRNQQATLYSLHR